MKRLFFWTHKEVQDERKYCRTLLIQSALEWKTQFQIVQFPII